MGKNVFLLSVSMIFMKKHFCLEGASLMIVIQKKRYSGRQLPVLQVVKLADSDARQARDQRK